MCSPVFNLPNYKEPPPFIPRIPITGLQCLPCGMDPVTVRRPLIVHDSTFDVRPTSWPGMLLNNQDKKIRYQLINFERPVKTHYPSCAPSYSCYAVLAVGQPPCPIAAFDKATIAIGHHHGRTRTQGRS